MIKKLHNLTNLKSEKIYVFLYFLIFLFIGLSIFDDYGISIDEDNLRVVGFLSLEQIYKFFSINNIFEITNIIKEDSLAHARDNTSTSGTFFDLPMAFIEYIFRISDSKDYFLLRHFFTFIIFFISSIYFYLIAKEKYKSTVTGILATSFLILSPRIFGESFFNNKDIVFMSFFIMGIYYAIKFLKNKNILSLVSFALISAIIVNIRILGSILPLIIILFYLIIILRNNEEKLKQLSKIFLFFFIFLTFYFILWPELWTDPINILIKTFNFMKNHFLSINIFYLGKYYFFSEIPWHYHLVNMFVSLPIVYTCFFLLGFFTVTRRLFTRLINIDENNTNKDLWRGEKEMLDYIFLILFVSVLFTAIDTGKISYNGWRHLYFIYPCFILISIQGLFVLQKNKLFKNKIKYLHYFVFLAMIPTIFWMYKNHPYQSLYFNFVFKNNYKNYFEVDYWGLTNKDALKIILKQKDELASIYIVSTSDLSLSKRIIDKKERSRIKIVGKIEDAKYIINHFYNWRSKESWQNYTPPSNFKLLKEIKINNVSINSIYKRQ